MCQKRPVGASSDKVPWAFPHYCSISSEITHLNHVIVPCYRQKMKFLSLCSLTGLSLIRSADGLLIAKRSGGIRVGTWQETLIRK